MTDADGGFDEEHAPAEAPDRRPRADRARTALLAATGVLAVVAVVTVVAADDARWLRLGVVAALWAALVAVWAVVRHGEQPDAAALRETYELELADEIAARREHELTVEVEVRRELEAARGAELEGLRDELARLRAAVEGRPVAAVPHGSHPGAAAPREAATGTAGADAVARARLQVVGGSRPTWDSGTYGGSQGPGPARPYGPPGGPAHGAPGYAAAPGRPQDGRPAGPSSDPVPVPDSPRPSAVPGPAGPPSPAQSWAATVPTHHASTGRTVAELLAAHAAAPPARRRRHDGS